MFGIWYRTYHSNWNQKILNKIEEDSSNKKIEKNNVPIHYFQIVFWEIDIILTTNNLCWTLEIKKITC